MFWKNKEPVPKPEPEPEKPKGADVIVVLREPNGLYYRERRYVVHKVWKTMLAAGDMIDFECAQGYRIAAFKREYVVRMYTVGTVSNEPVIPNVKSEPTPTEEVATHSD